MFHLFLLRLLFSLDTFSRLLYVFGMLFTHQQTQKGGDYAGSGALSGTAKPVHSETFPQGGDAILPLPLNSQVPGALVSEQAPRTGARGDRGRERGG